MSRPLQTDPPRPARETLPTMYDLPSEEVGEPGMPDEYHGHQATLLNETFRPPTVSPDAVFCAADLNLYYDVHHPNWCKRPDWFAVLGVPRLYEGRESRLSYVVWQEGVSPLVVVELLSPGTEKEDLGQTLRATTDPPTKWEVYERILRVPYYIVFGRVESEMRVFQLNTTRYHEVSGHDGRCWVAAAGLGLGLWRGSYFGQERLWLRWYDADGHWIPTAAEHAEQERQHAEQERQRAEQERHRAEQERREKEAAYHKLEQAEQRAARLAELLRQMGQDPDQI